MRSLVASVRLVSMARTLRASRLTASRVVLRIGAGPVRVVLRTGYRAQRLDVHTGHQHGL